MPFAENDLLSTKRKVERYKEVLQNTENYRAAWNQGLKKYIIQLLHELMEATNLPAELEERSEIGNLEAVSLNMGVVASGLGEPVGNGMRRDLIKQNGSLVYQQLFNGKVLVLINYPYIEKYGQPLPPRTLGIYRPEELKEPYFLRHFETFLSELTQWEDYDDDAPEPNQRIGFKFNFEQQQQDKKV